MTPSPSAEQDSSAGKNSGAGKNAGGDRGGDQDAGTSGSAPPSESLLTVLIALAANAIIAVAKTLVAVITGSASMVAEAAHSWADTGNEVLLLIAERRGRKGRDDTHPQGYGREAYVWSMFAAFGLFTVGAVVSIQHGISELGSTDPGEDYFWAYIVLALSFVLEGTSFIRSYQQSKKQADRRRIGVFDQVLTGSDPTVRAVFAEDAAALIGIAFAFLGILLHQLTGKAVFDAIGSILVGVLLGVVAVILIDRNRRFLVGESVDKPARHHILELLKGHPDIDRVTYLHAEFVGPGQLYIVAAVDIMGNQTEDHVAVRLRRIEAQLERNDHVTEAVLTLSAPAEVSL
ncbi:cation transporter [Gordonia jinhuaensis]|uniref:Cation diffusion facilitator transporter n=1 Tax=Gordonia jinhuaensis TaxID=1517702 RepID=A0A916T3V8_9ACTN|nr:cation transporter [Gordonia jinhuaensis]GGB29445.1 cation diffusion facilitator transporter [Gordonia jinhuaensis]